MSKLALTAWLAMAQPQPEKMDIDQIPNGQELAAEYCKGVRDKVECIFFGQFAEDFSFYNYEWTVEFCQMDSDGDGQHNGLELGDPYCIWVPGEVPDYPFISHPADEESSIDPNIDEIYVLFWVVVVVVDDPDNGELNVEEFRRFAQIVNRSYPGVISRWVDIVEDSGNSKGNRAASKRKRRSSSVDDAAETVFLLIDTDNDAIVDGLEFYNFIKLLQKRFRTVAADMIKILEDTEIKSMFENADKDKGGAIGETEFAEFVAKAEDEFPGFLDAMFRKTRCEELGECS